MPEISTLDIFNKLHGRRHYRLLAESDLREDLRFFVVTVARRQLGNQKIQGVWRLASFVVIANTVAEIRLPGYGFARLAKSRLIKTVAEEHKIGLGIVYELYITPKVLDVRPSIHNQHRRGELAEFRRFEQEALAATPAVTTEAAAA